MKLESYREIFEKYWSIKFYKNPSSGIWVVHCWRTDRYEEGNSPFPRFSESALKWVLRMHMKVIVAYSEVQLLYLSGWTDENNADIMQDSRYLDPNLNSEPLNTKHKCKTLDCDVLHTIWNSFLNLFFNIILITRPGFCMWLVTITI